MSSLNPDDYRILRARLEMAGFRSYAAYLASRKWKQFVREWLLVDGNGECGVCNRVSGVSPHHTSYEWLGEDSAHPEHLFPLCKTCHAAVHRILDFDRSPVSRTPEIVERLKRIIPEVKKRRKKR